MDPQNAQFYSLFVAPDLILWKIQDLKDRARTMTEDEVLHAYREIQYIASSAVSTSDHVKEVRRAGGAQPALDRSSDLGVDAVETEPEPKSQKTEKKEDKPAPKKKRRKRKPNKPIPPDEKLKMMQERGPLSNCPTPQAKAVRQIRFDKILSQKEFGEKVGVHPVSVAQYERATMPVSDYFVNKIVAAFPEYSKEDILNPPDEPEASETSSWFPLSDSTHAEAQGGQA